jgi:hypothetical protein
MHLFIIAGAPGMGKSPFVKSYIDGNNCLVFDVANEYGSRVKYAGQTPLNLSTNNNDARSRYIGEDLETFVKKCAAKRNTICVFEEATGFFQGAVQQLTMRLIIGRKHTGNVYLFIFHSINRIPPGIMEMAEYLVLFKTNDEWNTVRGKYARLLPYFEDLQNKPKGEKYIIPLI